MNVSFKIKIDGEYNEIILNTNDMEPLTSKTWLNLYNDNIDNQFPYYVIGFVFEKIFANGFPATVCSAFDGINLSRLLKEEKLFDDLNAKVKYQFLKCFDVQTDLSLMPNLFGKIEADDVFSDMEENFLFAGLGYGALGDSHSDSLENVSIIQHIVGSMLTNCDTEDDLIGLRSSTEVEIDETFKDGDVLKLNKHLAGVTWLCCAAKKGNLQASNLLKIIFDDL